jgi:hypothetical protein
VHARQAVRQQPEGRDQRFGGAVGIVSHQNPPVGCGFFEKILPDEV